MKIRDAIVELLKLKSITVADHERLTLLGDWNDGANGTAITECFLNLTFEDVRFIDNLVDRHLMPVARKAFASQHQPLFRNGDPRDHD